MLTVKRTIWWQGGIGPLPNPSHLGGALLALALIPLALGLVLATPAWSQNTEAEALYERGARALRGGDAKQAASYLSQAAQLEPNRWDIQALYARAQLVSGDNTGAISTFDRVESLNPDAKDLNYYRGIAAYRLGHWEDTIRYLGDVSPERAGSGRVHLYKGIAYQELNQFAPAEAELAEAARIDPTMRGNTSYRLGVMALEQRNVDEGRQYLEEVLEAVPDSALARSAKNYLDNIDSGLYRPFLVYAKLGGGYDSNVSLTTGEFQGLSSLKSGVGSAEIGVNGLILDTEKLDVRLGGVGFANLHGGKPASYYNQVFTQAFAIASYEINKRASLGLRYDFEYAWVNTKAECIGDICQTSSGYSDFRLSNSVTPSIRFIPYKGFVTNVFYQYQYRKYYLPLPASFGELDRTGNVQRAGIDQVWYTPNWTGWGKNFVVVSFAYVRERANGYEYDHDGYSPAIKIGVSLPWEAFFTSSFSYEWRNFDNVSCFQGYSSPLPPGFTVCGVPPSGKPKREDRIIQVRANLRIPIIQEIFVDLRYAFAHRNSNVDFYSYTRHVPEMVFTFRY
jgi:tetratricopeptide (TPR) repeat protein